MEALQLLDVQSGIFRPNRSMIQAGSDAAPKKGTRYLGSHYQSPPEISDLSLFSSDLF